IGLAADESIRRWADIDAVIAQGAADIVVIKVQPLGGLRRAHDTIKKAHAAGLQAVISSALETSVGIYDAATLQGFLESQNPHALDAGLGTVSFLGDDVVESPLRAHGGKLSVTKPRLDQGALTRLRAPKDREQWWRARLERCFALL
ncbi:MAG: O-succinylbenzoate synthase, partial [Microbacteriaceae bacterium]|nr:O-succinylbenzoate synthase [Microbacteriaceae bacterium]